MTNIFTNFLYMNGHGCYVWSAYGSVFILLAIQWFFPWRRWKSVKIKNASRVTERDE